MLIKKNFSVDLVVALKEGEGFKKKRVHTQMWSWTFEDRVYSSVLTIAIHKILIAFKVILFWVLPK